MKKMSMRIFYDLNNVKTLLFRRSRLITGLSNNIYFNSRRNAHSTIAENDFFQVQKKNLKTFWDSEGPFKILHKLNYLRLPYIRDSLVDVAPWEKFSTCLKGKKILDVGCGGGLLSEALAKLGAEVTGIDPTRELIEVAQQNSSMNKRLANNSPTYIHTTIEEFAESYDVVVASEVIDHVVEKELFVESCVRAAKPGGKLFFMTINRTRLAQLIVIFTYENILKVIPKGVYKLDMFIRPSELQYILEMNDCFVESTKGYFYYPFAEHWDWTKYKTFFFAIEAVKSN